MIEVMSVPHGIPSAAWNKFDRELRRWFERSPAELSATLPVLIVVKVADRKSLVRDNAAESESAFAELAKDLLDWLREHRASQVQLFWINGTVGASVPAGALGVLGARGDVEQIQLTVRRTAI